MALLLIPGDLKGWVRGEEGEDLVTSSPCARGLLWVGVRSPAVQVLGGAELSPTPDSSRWHSAFFLCSLNSIASIYSLIKIFI